MGDPESTSKPQMEVPKTWEKCEITVHDRGDLLKQKRDLVEFISSCYRIEMKAVFSDPNPQSPSITIKKADVRTAYKVGESERCDGQIASFMREMLTEMIEKFPAVEIAITYKEPRPVEAK